MCYRIRKAVEAGTREMVFGKINSQVFVGLKQSMFWGL